MSDEEQRARAVARAIKASVDEFWRSRGVQVVTETGEPFAFDCPLCGDTAYGNTRNDPAAMLCRDCHLDYIWSECATVEETLARMGYEPDIVPVLAADMRALFAVRADPARVGEICAAIVARNAGERNT